MLTYEFNAKIHCLTFRRETFVGLVTNVLILHTAWKTLCMRVQYDFHNAQCAAYGRRVDIRYHRICKTIEENLWPISKGSFIGQMQFQSQIAYRCQMYFAKPIYLIYQKDRTLRALALKSPQIYVVQCSNL